MIFPTRWQPARWAEPHESQGQGDLIIPGLHDSQLAAMRVDDGIAWFVFKETMGDNPGYLVVRVEHVCCVYSSGELHPMIVAGPMAQPLSERNAERWPLQLEILERSFPNASWAIQFEPAVGDVLMVLGRVDPIGSISWRRFENLQSALAEY
jgi:hypothetical protein